MKRFLLKVTLFFLLVIGISFVLDYIIQEGLKTSNYKEITKWNEVIEGGIDADLLILGSSRALDHFDCEYLEKKTGLKCYNLGVDGSKYPLQREMLKLYLSKNSLPRKIIWSLDLHSFEPITEFFGFEQFIPYQKHPIIKDLLKLNTKTPNIVYKIPLVRYSFNPKMKKRGIYSFFGKKGNVLLRKGYRQKKLTWDGTFEKQLAEIDKPKKNFINESNWKDFLNENKKLIEKDIEVSWIVSPYFGEFEKLISNHQEIITYYADQAAKNNIPFYDFIQPEWANSRLFFFDWRHLSELGVENFMDMLNDEMATN